ncbi:MAG TPA: CoA transferase, partial [Steroidobacteraceae bacterium]|nr:CoA transferase [Steroidobacteraceae bacterium]
MSARALDGIRVVELADAWGEWCGKLLADMGAEVVKVEPPEGCASRRVGPFAGDVAGPERSLYFWRYNTGKRSVTLDLAAAGDREALRRLVAGADVLLESLPPGEAGALGIAYETASAANPRLVHAAVTAFGQTGPYVDAAYRANDLIIMALGGPMQACGYDLEDADVAPVRAGPYHAYHTASHFACIGILTALLERETSGRGQFIDVSAQAASAVTVEFSNTYWEYARQVTRRQTGRHAFPRQTARTQYMCTDGRAINLAIPFDGRAYGRLVRYLREQGLGEGLADEAPDDPLRRLAEGSIVLGALEVLAARHSSEELFHIGQGMGFTWGAVRAPEDWLDDPHARARGFFVEIAHPEL